MHLDMPADTISRRVAEKLKGTYARDAVVENRTGAGGQVAIDPMRAAPRDGDPKADRRGVVRGGERGPRADRDDRGRPGECARRRVAHRGPAALNVR
jgi:hypothetical protein